MAGWYRAVQKSSQGGYELGVVGRQEGKPVASGIFLEFPLGIEGSFLLAKAEFEIKAGVRFAHCPRHI